MEMTKEIPSQGENRDFGNSAKSQGKHREFCVLKSVIKVLNFLILKIKVIVIFAAKFPILS